LLPRGGLSVDEFEQVLERRWKLVFDVSDLGARNQLAQQGKDRLDPKYDLGFVDVGRSAEGRLEVEIP